MGNSGNKWPWRKPRDLSIIIPWYPVGLGPMISVLYLCLRVYRSERSFTLIARFIGPTWCPSGGRQGPGGPHAGPMNFAIWIYIYIYIFEMILCHSYQAGNVSFLFQDVHRINTNLICNSVKNQYLFWSFEIRTLSLYLIIRDNAKSLTTHHPLLYVHGVLYT